MGRPSPCPGQVPLALRLCMLSPARATAPCEVGAWAFLKPQPGLGATALCRQSSLLKIHALFYNGFMPWNLIEVLSERQCDITTNKKTTNFYCQTELGSNPRSGILNPRNL